MLNISPMQLMHILVGGEFTTLAPQSLHCKYTLQSRIFSMLDPSKQMSVLQQNDLFKA